VGEVFPTEGTGEAVVFLECIERGFGVLAHQSLPQDTATL
jgi:hypothetical protein